MNAVLTLSQPVEGPSILCLVRIRSCSPTLSHSLTWLNGFRFLRIDFEILYEHASVAHPLRWDKHTHTHIQIILNKGEIISYVQSQLSAYRMVGIIISNVIPTLSLVGCAY